MIRNTVEPPGYVRVAGGLTLALGAATAFWLRYDIGGWGLVFGLAMMLGGIGLIAGVRWAWPFIVLAAIPFFYVAWVFTLPESETDPFELDHEWSVFFAAVGCLLLIASLTRGTRRWLIGRSIERGRARSA